MGTSALELLQSGEAAEEQTIVVTGNPVDGLFFHGPFTAAELASNWAKLHYAEGDWWLAPLLPPRGLEEQEQDVECGAG